MASITIHNLDDDVRARLRIAAAGHGCSMEDEVRRILLCALTMEDGTSQLGTRIHKRFAKLGGLELLEFDRSMPRAVPVFSNQRPSD